MRSPDCTTIYSSMCMHRTNKIIISAFTYIPSHVYEINESNHKYYDTYLRTENVHSQIHLFDRRTEKKTPFLLHSRCILFIWSETKTQIVCMSFLCITRTQPQHSILISRQCAYDDLSILTQSQNRTKCIAVNNDRKRKISSEYENKTKQCSPIWQI